MMQQDKTGANKIWYFYEEYETDKTRVVLVVDTMSRAAGPTTDYGAAHEAWHFVGHPDKYNEETNQSYEGWESNIMASNPGIPDERNIVEILYRHDKISQEEYDDFYDNYQNESDEEN